MESKSNTAILYIILLMVVVNFGLTASLWLSRSEPASEPVAAAEIGLPDYADSEYLAELADQMLTLFNDRDFATMYEAFDELTRAQIGLEDVEREMGRLSEVLGKAKTPAFLDYESTKHGAHQLFVLSYAIQLEDGPFDNGQMVLTVVDRGDRFGFVGINIIGGSAT